MQIADREVKNTTVSFNGEPSLVFLARQKNSGDYRTMKSTRLSNPSAFSFPQ